MASRLNWTVGITGSDLVGAQCASVLGLGGQDAERVLKALERARGALRRQVTRVVDLKFSPELRFRLDETFDRMDETRRMLTEGRVRADLDKD